MITIIPTIAPSKYDDDYHDNYMTVSITSTDSMVIIFCNIL